MARQSKDQVLYDVHTHFVNLNRREIYLHSYYVKDDESEPGVDYRQATTFIKNLHILDQSPHRDILIHLHSDGGCWDNGMSIFNSVEYARSRITMLGYSQTSSMSGIIFQSADLRIMMPDCHFMLHHGYAGGSVSHPFALKNEAMMQERASKRMLQIFAEAAIATESAEFFTRKKSSTVDTAYKFFDRKLKEEVDWYMSAEEAVFYGLADGIIGSDDYPDLDSLRVKD